MLNFKPPIPDKKKKRDRDDDDEDPDSIEVGKNHNPVCMSVCVTLLVTNTFCYQNDTFTKGVLPANYICKFDGFRVDLQS